MRGRIRVGAFGLGSAGLLVLTLVTPAAGLRNPPDAGCDQGCQAPASKAGSDCADASMNTPRGEPGDVKLTADVRDGATVAPGQDIRLTLSWDKGRWSGPERPPPRPPPPSCPGRAPPEPAPARPEPA